ncbi:phosphopantetheine-binding protein [Thalassococcus sp. S3]|uniref:phosphopantetheine-binding protein n=1 Tax=Thalassococcus sp. S3 TaxID=2017482 RepID=UPI00102466DA|nr:phosphopantetheine-binding protein [Thalassococcus sp. S3]QBF33925.1 hypothetical protein CFI11_22355 [Thalassococcus sp. S3]
MTNSIPSALREYARELLDITDLPEDAMFLELGGNSLSAVMLANRLEEDFGIRVCTEDILVSTLPELDEICSGLSPEG